MGRLPSLTPRQVVQALMRAGFTEHHQHGSHLHLKPPDAERLITVPMHARELPRGTLMAIAKQSGLTLEEFEALF